MRVCETLAVGAVGLLTLSGAAVAQVGFWPASELVAVEPPASAAVVNAGQVILGMAQRYVVRIGQSATARIGVTTDFSEVHQLPIPTGGLAAEAVAVSDDGARVIGRVGFSAPGLVRTCVWDGDSSPVVVNADGVQYQEPVAMSGDGRKLLIRSGYGLSQRSTVVDDGVHYSIDPVGEEPQLDTRATALSHDGLAVVGQYNDYNGWPFLWSAASGGRLLEPPASAVWPAFVANGGARVIVGHSGGVLSFASGQWRAIASFTPSCMCADGSLVLGTSPAPSRAAVWSETRGPEDLGIALTARGIDVRGWTLTHVEYVSADGRRIVGRGTAPGSSVVRRWAATIEPYAAADMGRAGGVNGSDGKLDNNDFIVFINRFFAQDERADCGRAGAERGGDGAFDNNDFCAFINLFFSGEP